jgi:type IV pilus assembly protein PilM
LQVLGFGRIQSNLLPKSIVRSQAWAMKIRLFMVAACFLLLISAMSLGRVIVDTTSYAGKATTRGLIKGAIGDAQDSEEKRGDERSQGDQYRENMQKVLSLYKYRDTIPWIYETILDAMPNAQNNPVQKVLYAALAAGDIEAVKQIPRRDRKQLLVTRMQISYAEDLEIAEFDQINLGQGPASAADDPFQNDPRMAMYDMAMMNQGTTEIAKSPGFVVVIEGHSPYQDIGQLLDPSGVDSQPENWGFVTQLMHLSDRADPNNDPNTPLGLYKKETKVHFDLKKGPVAFSNKEMPYGIGVQEDEEADLFGTAASEDVTLLDPVTGEVINSYPLVDNMGREVVERLSKKVKMVINDNWFVLKFKLKWNYAPSVEGDADAADSPPSMSGYER